MNSVLFNHSPNCSYLKSYCILIIIAPSNENSEYYKFWTDKDLLTEISLYVNRSNPNFKLLRHLKILTPFIQTL